MKAFLKLSALAVVGMLVYLALLVCGIAFWGMAEMMWTALP